MKKAIRSLLSLVMVLVTIFSMIPTASAATCKDKKSIKYAYQAGVKTTIYVNSSDKKTATLNYTSSNGALATNDGKLGYKKGYVEVKIFGKNGSGWKQINKYNIKDRSSYSISMKGYTQYKVEFWTWTPRTIGSYLGGRYNWNDICWMSYPCTSVSAKTNNITKIS